MPMSNADIARVLTRIADLLDIKGANEFRVRAYQNAARTIEDLPQSVRSMIEDDQDLSELSGIGDDLAGKIEEIAETGTLDLLEDLEDELPAGLAELSKLEGLGPKRVQALHDELGIEDLDELKQAAEDGKVADLDGFGEKTQQKILDEIEREAENQGRTRLFEAEQIVDPLFAYLKDADGVKDAVIAGSYRRRKATVGDADILVTCKQGKQGDVMDRFVDHEDVDEVVSHGEKKSTVRLRSGFQVDLRVVPEVAYGAALHYFTGAKAHNIEVRKRGVARGLKINEYGVFKDDERVAGRTEEEVFAAVDLPYIEPVLRENRGEIEAAENDELPELVTLDDIRGDLHAHTKITDGRDSLEDMAEAAKERGYDYLAITNHSKRVTVATGLDAEALAEHLDEIDRLNDGLSGIRILKSAEVDILEDGSLDLPDDILDRLDLTVVSVHYHRGLSETKQTERVIRALDNPHANILAHPTGRLINERDPFEIDLEAVMEAAVERGCFLEINAAPDRLDLADVNAHMAKDMGLKVAISTDAHSVDSLAHMRFGVDQARRGWLEKDDVVNTRKWGDLKKLLKR